MWCSSHVDSYSAKRCWYGSSVVRRRMNFTIWSSVIGYQPESDVRPGMPPGSSPRDSYRWCERSKGGLRWIARRPPSLSESAMRSALSGSSSSMNDPASASCSRRSSDARILM